MSKENFSTTAPIIKIPAFCLEANDLIWLPKKNVFIWIDDVEHESDGTTVIQETLTKNGIEEKTIIFNSNELVCILSSYSISVDSIKQRVDRISKEREDDETDDLFNSQETTT